jgi:hypothetical protein
LLRRPNSAAAEHRGKRVSDDCLSRLLARIDLLQPDQPPGLWAGDADFEALTGGVHRADRRSHSWRNAVGSADRVGATVGKEQRPRDSIIGRIRPRRNTAASWSRQSPALLPTQRTLFTLRHRSRGNRPPPTSRQGPGPFTAAVGTAIREANAGWLCARTDCSPDGIKNNGPGEASPADFHHGGAPRRQGLGGACPLVVLRPGNRGSGQGRLRGADRGR